MKRAIEVFCYQPTTISYSRYQLTTISDSQHKLKTDD